MIAPAARVEPALGPTTTEVYRQALRVVRIALAVLLGGITVLAELNWSLTAGMLILLGVLIVTVRYRWLAGVLDSVAGGVVPIALDLTCTVGVLGFTGADSGSAAWLVLVLPLAHAGVRRGVYGITVAWLTAALAIGAWEAHRWNGIAFSMTDPAIVLATTWLAALPIGHLSDRMAGRAGQYLAATDLANHRADVLAAVFDATTDLTNARRDAIDAVLLEWAVRLTSGAARLAPAHDIIAEPGLVEQARALDGEAVVAETDRGVEIALAAGGPSQSILVVECATRPETLSIEALELLVIQARLATAVAADSLDLSVRAEELVDLLFARRAA